MRLKLNITACIKLLLPNPEKLCDPLKSMSEKWYTLVIDRTTPTFITLTIVGWVDLFSRPVLMTVLMILNQIKEKD
jgi:hypothetical protein